MKGAIVLLLEYLKINQVGGRELGAEKRPGRRGVAFGLKLKVKPRRGKINPPKVTARQMRKWTNRGLLARLDHVLDNPQGCILTLNMKGEKRRNGFITYNWWSPRDRVPHTYLQNCEQLSITTVIITIIP